MKQDLDEGFPNGLNRRNAAKQLLSKKIYNLDGENANPRRRRNRLRTPSPSSLNMEDSQPGDFPLGEPTIVCTTADIDHLDSIYSASGLCWEIHGAIPSSFFLLP